MPLVVFNQKGGVGKSTITCNLAAISAAQGLRTLVIDLDQQGNSTSYLLGDSAAEDQPNVAGFFENTLSFSLRTVAPDDFIVGTPFEALDLMPSRAGRTAGQAGVAPQALQTARSAPEAGRDLRPHLYRHPARAELLHPLGPDRRTRLPDPVRLRRVLAQGALHPDGQRAGNPRRPQPRPGRRRHRGQPVPAPRQPAAARGAGTDRRRPAGAAALPALVSEDPRIARTKPAHDLYGPEPQADAGAGGVACGGGGGAGGLIDIVLIAKSDHLTLGMCQYTPFFTG